MPGLELASEALTFSPGRGSPARARHRLRGGTEASPHGARVCAREHGRLGDSRAGSSVRARRTCCTCCWDVC